MQSSGGSFFLVVLTRSAACQDAKQPNSPTVSSPQEDSQGQRRDIQDQGLQPLVGLCRRALLESKIV